MATARRRHNLVLAGLIQSKPRKGRLRGAVVEREHKVDSWRHLGQAASVLSIVGLSVLTMMLLQHVLSASSATAQAGPAQEIRASAFVLVAADGTVLGRLGSGGAGSGNLTLFDA